MFKDTAEIISEYSGWGLPLSGQRQILLAWVWRGWDREDLPCPPPTRDRWPHTGMKWDSGPWARLEGGLREAVSKALKNALSSKIRLDLLLLVTCL